MAGGDLGSDAIRDMLLDSDDETDVGLDSVNLTFIDELNENVNDPILDSDSDGEFVDNVMNDPDFMESQQVSDLEDEEYDDIDVDDEDVDDPQPSTSSARPRPIATRCEANRPKRKRSSQVPSDIDLGWSEDDIQPQLPVFEEISGIKVPIDETSTPFDIFSLFFPQTLITLFKTETNRYAKSVIDKLRRSNSLKKNSIWGKWTTVKLHDVYLFFSIILHMSVVKKFRLRDYWSTDKFISSVYAASVMSRDRFLAILSNFHINDNSTAIPYNQPGHDPLHKLSPYINHLLLEFKKSFYPYENLTVDEGTCGFRGRVRFRVYNKNKPDKYGIKLYIVCDSSTGYVLKLEVYTGKSEDSSITTLFGRLLCDYLGKGHTVFMDRFYSSPVVFDYLWENKTKGVGTCMRNRKQLPKTVVSKKLKKDETSFMRRHHLLCLKWKDKRDVLALSTAHKMTFSNVTVRSREGPVLKAKPDVIVDYNKNKTGVDRSDQIVAYYPFKRKQMKWWKKLFFHLFMMSISNAFILYRETRLAHLRKKCHLYQFIIAIGKALGEKGGQLAGESSSVDLHSTD